MIKIIRVKDCALGCPYYDKAEGGEWEIPMLNLNLEEAPLLTFNNDGEVVGKLWYKNQAFSFEGNCEESGRIFFDWVIQISKRRNEMQKITKVIKVVFYAYKENGETTEAYEFPLGKQNPWGNLVGSRLLKALAQPLNRIWVCLILGVVEKKKEGILIYKTTRVGRGIAALSELDVSTSEGLMIARTRAIEILKGKHSEPIRRKEIVELFARTGCPFRTKSEMGSFDILSFSEIEMLRPKERNK